jgi:hypothetical protein
MAGPTPGDGTTPEAGPTYDPFSPPEARHAYDNTFPGVAGPVYETIPTPGAAVPRHSSDPVSPPPAWSDIDPRSGTPADPYGFEVAGRNTPRIEPSPKQPRGRFLLPALAGLLAGLLLFGTGGWFLGRATTTAAKPTVTTTTQPVTPSAAPAGAYEQNQIAINQPKLRGTLATVSQGWLPYISGCSRSGDKGGPALNDGEKTRVRCEMDAMSVIFVEYDSTAERDKARVSTLAQNVDARTLTPGVGAAVQRPTPSGRTSGNYVEYAYRAAGRTVSAIWWDDAATPVAAYLLAFWKEGAGEKWEPMRDVWARYA